MNILTAETLKELVIYDPETGMFTSKVGRRGVKKGTVLGCKNPILGYVVVGIDGGRFYAHRLAFLYMTGSWPESEIDHRNGIRDDNSWVNLRSSTSSQNKQNKKCRTDSRTKYKWVTFHPRTGKFRAMVRKNGKKFDLGLYPCPENAHCAARSLAKILHGEFFKC